MKKRPSPGGRAGWTRNAFEAILGFAGSMVDLELVESATIVFSACMAAWEHIESQEEREEGLDYLMGSIANTIPPVEPIRRFMDPNLIQLATRILHTLEDVSVFVLNFELRGTLERAFFDAIDSSVQEQLDGFINKFKRLRGEFNAMVADQTSRADEIEKMRSKLMPLKPIEKMKYDLKHQCAKGTRLDIVEDLVAWSQKSGGSQRLAWVRGPTGIGKSSIATSICKRLDEKGLLMSSFFCKRGDPELCDPRQVLKTIVYGLALRWHAYGDAVATTLNQVEELESRNVQPLYEILVTKPLQEIPRTQQSWGASVVMVDGLDECGDLRSRRQLLSCLRNLSQSFPWIRIITTSRPDTDIQWYFEHAGAEWFIEYNVLNYDSLADIQLFLQYRLRDAISFRSGPQDITERLSATSGGLFLWAETACKFILDGQDKQKQLELLVSGHTHINDLATNLDMLYATLVNAVALDSNGNLQPCILECLGAILVTSHRTPLPLSDLAKLLRGRISLEYLDRVVGAFSSVLYVDQGLGGAVRPLHSSFMDYMTTRSRSKDLYINLEEQNAMIAECCLVTMVQELRFNICELETSHVLNRDVPDLNIRVEKTIKPHLIYSCVHWASHITRAHGEGFTDPLREFLFGAKLLYWLEVLSLIGKFSTSLPSLQDMMNSRVLACDDEELVNDVYRFIQCFYEPISQSAPHLYISALAFAPERSGIALRLRHHFSRLLLVAQGLEKKWTRCSKVIFAPDRPARVALAPDGRRILSGSMNGAIRLLDTSTGEIILESLYAHSSKVQSVAFAPDGLRFVSCSDDKTVRIWDAETGELVIKPLQGHTGPVYDVAFSPDGHRIVSCSADSSIRVWDAITGQTVLAPLQNGSGRVYSVAFSHSGDRIASGSSDGSVRIWDAKSGELVFQPLKHHSAQVYSVSFSHDDRFVVSGSEDRNICICDMERGNAIHHPLQGHSDAVYSVAFLGDGSSIVSGSADHTVRIWDRVTGQQVCQPLRGHSDTVWSVLFSKNRRHIISSSSDNTIRAWDLGDMSAWFRARSDINTPRLDSSMFSYGTDLLGASRPHTGSTTRELKLPRMLGTTRWYSSKIESICRHFEFLPKFPLQATRSQKASFIDGHLRGIVSASFSEDGRFVASGDEGGTVCVWDVESGNRACTPMQDGAGKAVRFAMFSADGNQIICGYANNTARIWDTKTGGSLSGPTQGCEIMSAQSMALSRDRLRIASGSSNMIYVWNIETGGKILGPIVGHSSNVNAIAFSHDGRLIVSASKDMSVRIWSAETGNALFDPLVGHSEPIKSVTFSPDSRRVISGTLSGTSFIWDISTGGVAKQLKEKSGWVAPIAISNDNRRVVSGSLDQKIRIRDLDTGDEVLGPLQGHTGFITSIEFSPNNNQIVSSSYDCTVRIWNLERRIEHPHSLNDILFGLFIYSLTMFKETK
ncbi:hypothetical protein RhiLY_10327 [Ceratobasidium sp. AG-Ba]|nr:hypothetical protein RhiLY_10327 [Ceratobasidium sp. AG-Ba]